MFDNKKILALIPARGGSKGIKDKNIYPLAGKPLLGYSITAAKQSQYLDRILVSTDSTKIADIALKYGAEVPFMRPEELAQDASLTIDTVLYTVNMLKSCGCNFDTLVLLQPTQPLRTVNDIDSAIELFFEKGEQPLVSVSPVEEHPLLIRTIEDNGELKPLLNENSTCRRQDMAAYYKVNGCIYINSIIELSNETSFNDNSIPYVMDRSHSVDIDELVDVAEAEYYLSLFNYG